MSVSTFNMAEAQMLNNQTIFSNIQKETEKMAILSGFMHTHTNHVRFEIQFHTTSSKYVKLYYLEFIKTKLI